EHILSLIKDCDVFVHSLRNSSIERLGLSYEELKQINEKIIYCGMYGYGKEGRHNNKPAYDDIVQASSGIAATQGEMMGTPQYLATLLGDKTAGLVGVYAIIAALFHRERTGEGQEVEVPMFESLVSFNMVEHLYGHSFSPALGDAYYSRAVSSYRKPYKTKDGYLSVLIYNDKHWKSFFKAANKVELQKDPRFKDLSARTQHIDYVYETVENLMAKKTTEEWIPILEKADIPFAKIQDPVSLLS